jgi:HEAT repeat protein
VARLLADGDGAVRRLAIETMQKLGERGFSKQVARLMADEDWRVRGAAAAFLRSLDAQQEVLEVARDLAAKRRSGAPALPRHDTCDMKEIHLSHLGTELALLFSGRITEVTPLLLAAFGHDLATWHGEFETYLRIGMSTGQPPPDLDPLFDHPAADIRAEAVNLAGLAQLRAVVPAIRRRLADRDSIVVATTCWALSVLDAKEAIHEITPLLRHGSSEVRTRAFLAIEALGANPRLESLIHDGDPAIRDWALDVLRGRDRY